MSSNQHTSDFESLPEYGFVRESQLVQNPKRPIPNPLLPFSSSTLWREVKKKKFPAPVKLTSGVTAWRVRDIRIYLQKLNAANLQEAK
jgi:hypothetical protein